MQSDLVNNEGVGVTISEEGERPRKTSRNQPQTYITHRCEKVCCLGEASGSVALAAEWIHRASAVWPKSPRFSFRMLKTLLLPFNLPNYKNLLPCDSWAVTSDPSHLIWMSLREWWHFCLPWCFEIWTAINHNNLHPECFHIKPQPPPPAYSRLREARVLGNWGRLWRKN